MPTSGFSDLHSPSGRVATSAAAFPAFAHSPINPLHPDSADRPTAAALQASHRSSGRTDTESWLHTTELPTDRRNLPHLRDDGLEQEYERLGAPHWMIGIQLYPSLAPADAAAVLHYCLTNINVIVSDVFAAEVEAVMHPVKDLHHRILHDNLQSLIRVLERLPEECFLSEDGRTPDPQFYNVVRGLCLLWNSSDTSQLSSVMRHISISRPAAAVAQLAATKKIRLARLCRARRFFMVDVSSSKLHGLFYTSVTLLALTLVASLAGLMGVINTSIALAVVIAAGVAALLGYAFLFGVLKQSRDSAEAALRTVRLAAAAGIVRFVMPSDLGEQTSLAKPQAAAGSFAERGSRVSHARRAASPASAADLSQEGEVASLSMRSAGIFVPLGLRFKYPHGVLLLPSQTPSNRNADGDTSRNTEWICVDARPLSRATMLLGMDTERNIIVWNEAAEEVSGYLGADTLGQKIIERVTCKGDTLFRLPRLVGESTPIGLSTLASGKMNCDAIVADIRGTNGELAGFMFVCPTSKENNKHAMPYLHEYHWHELTGRAQVLEFSAKQLRDCVKNAAQTPSVVAEETPISTRTASVISGYAAPVVLASGALEGRKTSPPAQPLHSASLVQQSQVNIDDIGLLANSIQRQTASLRSELRQLSWDALSNMARAIATEWEWTNGERLLGTAARYHFAKANVRVDSSLPVSFRLPPSAARVAKTVLTFAPAHCDVSLHYSQLSPRVGRITVEVKLEFDSPLSSERRFSVGRQSVNLDNLRQLGGPNALHPKFDTERLLKEISRDLADACASFYATADDTIIHVNFPCIRDVNADSSMSDDGPQGLRAAQQATATRCDCAVAVCLEEPVEQHNLGMMLLGVQGVSLSLCRDVTDLAARIQSFDIVIVANSLRDSIEVPENASAVVIPVVEEHASFPGEQSHLRLPFHRETVLEMIVSASEVVATNKRLQQEARQRDEVLAARHDAPWTKGALLGKGSFGTVYVAINELTGGKMAVKQFDFNGRAEALEAAMDSLMNEIRILTKLDHPNIVHYLYCERTAGGINLFMELCETSLASILAKRKRVAATLRHAVPVIMHQTMSAVAYLHSLNVVHRDIKPQNMLVKADKVKLTDFGTAHQAVSGELLRDTQGTFRFMAPEVYQGKAYNLTCDTWSIGCVLCELLDVKLPFMQHGQYYLLADLKQSDVSLAHATHLTEDEKEFISVCLQVQKEFRPPVATLLMHPYFHSVPPSTVIAELLRQVSNADEEDEETSGAPPVGSEVDDGDGFTLRSSG